MMSRTNHGSKLFSYAASESTRRKASERLYKKRRSGQERMLLRKALSRYEEDVLFEQAPWNDNETLKLNEWWA